MDYGKESLKMHYDLRGKIEIKTRAAVDSKEALSLAYTWIPGNTFAILLSCLKESGVGLAMM